MGKNVCRYLYIAECLYSSLRKPTAHGSGPERRWKPGACPSLRIERPTPFTRHDIITSSEPILIPDLQCCGRLGICPRNRLLPELFTTSCSASLTPSSTRRFLTTRSCYRGWRRGTLSSMLTTSLPTCCPRYLPLYYAKRTSDVRYHRLLCAAGCKDVSDVVHRHPYYFECTSRTSSIVDFFEISWPSLSMSRLEAGNYILAACQHKSFHHCNKSGRLVFTGNFSERGSHDSSSMPLLVLRSISDRRRLMVRQRTHPTQLVTPFRTGPSQRSSR